MDRAASPATAGSDDNDRLHRLNAQLNAQLDELTDALVAANDQLIVLYQLSRQTAGSLEPAIAAHRALTRASALIGASSVTFLPETAGLTKPITVGIDDHRGAIAKPAVPTTKPRIDRTLHDGRSNLVAPVRTGDRTFGTVVARSGRQRDFTTGDLKLLEAIANHLALILELSTLHADAVTQALVQRDHDTASTLAQAALGIPLPTVQGLDVAAVAIPARSAGGDFYAAGRTPTGLYVALGDVSGKGLPAALVMTNAVWAVRGAFDRHRGGDVGAVLDDVDRQLADYLAGMGMFITMAVAHVDLATSELTITNSGQSPILVGAGATLTPAAADGPPIGVLAPRSHTSTRHPFDPGAILLIGSDGCTEQRGHDERMLGEDAVHRLTATGAGRTAADTIDALVEAVAGHRAQRDQDDDLTAIVVRRPGSAVSEARP